MSVQSTQGILVNHNMIQDLKCPISSDWLTKAVSLTPCMDKVNLRVAVELFSSKGSARKKYCPVCKREILKYYPDPLVRKLAKEMKSMNEERVSIIVESISSNTLIPSTKLTPPGDPAKFVVTSNRMGQPQQYGVSIVFKSTTESWIRQVSLEESYDEKLVLSGEYKYLPDFSAQTYFTQFGLEGLVTADSLRIQTDRPDHMMVLLTALGPPHQFPKKVYGGMVQLIMKKNNDESMNANK